MNNILSAEEIKNYKDIGNKIDVNKINPIISQAQDVDFRDYLGMKFYFDVLSNIENPQYADLINGSTFSYDNTNFIHKGLKAMLADFFMSRYVMLVNINITPFGATTKQTPDSETASESSLRSISTMHKQDAGAKWEIIQLYLKVNKAQFPNYNSYTDTINSGERRLKFTRI